MFLAHASLGSRVRHASASYATVAAPLIVCRDQRVVWRSAVCGKKKSSALRILIELGRTDAGLSIDQHLAGSFDPLTLAGVMDAPLKQPRDFPSVMFPTEMRMSGTPMIDRIRPVC